VTTAALFHGGAALKKNAAGHFNNVSVPSYKRCTESHEVPELMDYMCMVVRGNQELSFFMDFRQKATTRY